MIKLGDFRYTHTFDLQFQSFNAKLCYAVVIWSKGFQKIKSFQN